VTTSALSCWMKIYPNKKPANYSFEREKPRYHCATFHNEIHPRENNLILIPSGQTNKIIFIWHFSYHMSYQPETPILAQGPETRGLIWVEGWYGMWYEKCHIITYLSYTSMRLSSFLWELIVFRNHVAWFGIWCNNVILYLRFYYMYLET
jgi:hypothetical protein